MASVRSVASKALSTVHRRTTTGWVISGREFASFGSCGGSGGAGSSASKSTQKRAVGSQVSTLQGPPASLLPFLKKQPASPALGSARLTGPAVWSGEDLKGSKWWGHHLTSEDIADLHQAVEAAKASGAVQWRAEGVPEKVAREAFPLGLVMRQKLAEMSEEIEEGKGLAMIRNMPVQDSRFTEDDMAVAYLGMSAHIGHVVLQSSSGLRSVSRGYGMPLGRVQAEMTGETPKAGLQTNNHFRLHTDRCDVISLLSIRTAPKGGASRVCSAPMVHNVMVERYPELAKALCEPIDRIWEGENGYFRLPVWDLTPEGKFTTQISPSYVESAQFLANATKASVEQIAALDALELIGMEVGAEFVMQPGMLYFLNNHQVYHGRGNWAVTDSEQSGEWGKQGRLLMRTWISPYNSRALPDTPEYRFVWGNVEGGQPRGGFDQALKTGEVPKAALPEDFQYYSLFDSEVQQHSMWGQAGTTLQY